MMISVKNLKKLYKNILVLDSINIDFDCRINLLYGGNGEGKTTIINMLAGVIKPNQGAIYINEEKINFADGTYKNNIGFVLNLPTFPYHLKVKEYIDLLNSIYSIDLILNKTYQNELLVFFGLDKYVEYQLSELSTGYIKRAKLFASMLHNPSCYIFDEPFSSLDRDFIPLLIEKINTLSNQGKYFLITTHLSQITSYNFSNCGHYKISNGTIQKED